jgi:hypothetical protein
MKGAFAMELKAPLAKLSPDQIAALRDYEGELAKKFGTPVILLAFDR